MKILFRKKEEKAIILFRQLERANSQLLSIDTEISFITEYTSEEEIQKLVKASDEWRETRRNILNKLMNLA